MSSSVFFSTMKLKAKFLFCLALFAFLAKIELSAQFVDTNVTEVSKDAVKGTGTSDDYVLRPADLLEVKVFQEEDLTRQVSVSKDYTISLPLIGSIDLRDKTVRQVEKMVKDMYGKDYLVNPQVNVTVIRYAERTVNVMGAVNKPGPVIFPQEQGLTLMEAITRAGGVAPKGYRGTIILNRIASTGESSTLNFDVRDLLNGKIDPPVQIQVGDTIFVKESTF